jgi:hypothetical protein
MNQTRRPSEIAIFGMLFVDAIVASGMLERNGDAYSNTADTNFYLDRSRFSASN